MQLTILNTERLQLRKLTPEVYDYIYKTLSEEEQLHFLGISTLEELKKEQEKHKNGLATYNKSFAYFQVFDKETHKLIGWCGYHTWYTDHDRAEIGYGLINDSYKNKGLMTEALLPIINYGFQTMNLFRIEAFIGLDNIPSHKLLTKFGFIQEGLLRNHYLKDGVYEDSAIFSILKPDYLASNINKSSI